MFITEKPEAFISGIFAQKGDCLEYAVKNFAKGDGHKVRELREINHYPFFIIERPKGSFKFLQYKKDLPKKWQKKKGYTVYTITKDWQPPTPKTDYMGALEHEHSDEEV